MAKMPRDESACFTGEGPAPEFVEWARRGGEHHESRA